MDSPRSTQIFQLSRQIDLAYFEMTCAPHWEDPERDAGDARDLVLSHFAEAGGGLAEQVSQLAGLLEVQTTPEAKDRASVRKQNGRILLETPAVRTWRDIILFAHEVTHGLHMIQPTFDAAPTLWREVIAFLGELLFIDHLACKRTLSGDEAKWLEAAYYNGLYLGPRNTDLQQMLDQLSPPTTDALYPIARCCALEMRRGLTLANLPDLLNRAPLGLDEICAFAQSQVDRWMTRISDHADPARPDQTLGTTILRALGTRNEDMKVSDAAQDLLGSDNVFYRMALRDQSTIPPIAAGEVFAWRRVFVELADCLAGYSLSSYHRNLRFNSFFRREVLPPLILRQCYLSPHKAGTTPGIFSWAFLSAEVADDVLACGRALDLHEWRGGPKLFVNDFYSAKGHTSALFAHMRTMPLFKKPDRILAVARNPDGSHRRIRSISLAGARNR